MVFQVSGPSQAQPILEGGAAAAGGGLASIFGGISPLGLAGTGLNIISSLSAGPSRGDIRQSEAAQRQLREGEAVTDLQRILLGGQPQGPSAAAFAPIDRGPSAGQKLGAVAQDVLALASFQQQQASTQAKAQVQASQFQAKQKADNLRELNKIQASKDLLATRLKAEADAAELVSQDKISQILFGSLEKGVLETQKAENAQILQRIKDAAAAMRNLNSGAGTRRAAANDLRRGVLEKKAVGITLTPQDNRDLAEGERILRETAGAAPLQAIPPGLSPVERAPDQPSGVSTGLPERASPFINLLAPRLQFEP